MSTLITVGGKQIGRLRASMLLFKETFRFISLDKEMLLVPVAAFFLELVLFGILGLAMFATGTLGALEAGASLTSLSEAQLIALFLVYVLSAYVIAWTQAVIAHIVYTRAHGGDSSLSEGVSVAFGHTFDLLFWSVITSTVGIILRALAERSKLLGRILAALFGAAWAVLTYFVVPSMVVGKRSAIDAIKDSTMVFRKTWGETLITNVSFSLVFTLALILFGFGLVALALILGLSYGVVIMLLVIFLCIVFVLALLSSVMSSVLRTLLYVYASEGTVPENFNRELLEQIIARNAGAPGSSIAPGTGTSFV